MSAFAGEIAEQPAVARRLLAAAERPVAAIAGAIRERRPAGFLIAARGSSDHAATYAKYLFEIRNRLPVALAAPSAFTLYRRPPRLGAFCVLAISQSGSSEDVVEVVAEARRQGSPTLVLTNAPRSALARAAEHVLDLAAGEERSVPASKTYIASLVLLAMLSQALDPDPELAAGLAAIPGAIERTIAMTGELDRAAAALDGPRLAVLGRGFNLATAEEVALKIMEICYVVAESRSVADFLHGPIAVVERGFPALLLEAGGPTLPDMRDLARRLAGLGARLVAITDQEAGPEGAEAVIRLPTGLPESLTPIPFTVAGQRLALRTAIRRGLDPDRPRGLHKVTVTR